MNLHKFYYKEYFEGIDFEYLSKDKPAPKNVIDDIKRKNQKLLSCSLSKGNDLPTNGLNTFQLKTVYPGLVTGVGITHEAKIEGEFKLGVHFDYTFGMPVIYGSSVKGTLRSYFKDFLPEKFDKKQKEDLEKDIFAGEISEGKLKSIYNRDIFYDAVIVRSNGPILASDSITPHGDNPLKNPIPITFLKIAPGCTIEFRFKLVDSKIGEQEFTAKQKLKLFEDILKTVGVGAKTNVGYGQFE